MNANKSLKSLCRIALAIAVGSLLGGCNDQGHSKPNLDDVKSVIQDQYGECTQWAIDNIERLDGVATNNRGIAAYGVKYSFVLTFKDPGLIENTVRPVIEGHVSFKPGPCIGGLDLVARGVDLTNSRLAARYKVTVISIFERSEQGWHLIDDPNASVAQDISPLDDSANQFGASMSAVSSSSEPAAPAAAAEKAVSSAAASNAPSSAVPASGISVATSPDASPSPAVGLPATPSTAEDNSANANQATPAPQPAAPTVAPSAPQPPAARALSMTDLEGDWHGTYQCGLYIGSGSVSDPDAWTRQVTMTIHHGQATLVRQVDGDGGFREAISGNVLPDLALHLGGTGQRIGAAHPWYADFMGRFADTAGQATFEARGTLSDWHRDEFRACRLALSR